MAFRFGPDICEQVITGCGVLEPCTVTADRVYDPKQRFCERWKASTESLAFETLERFGCDEVNVLRYGVGGHFGPHTDTISGRDRQTTVVVQLSDPGDYTGGELCVNGRVQPKTQGATIVFLSSSRHSVMPLRSGVRWVLIGWSPLDTETVEDYTGRI